MANIMLKGLFQQKQRQFATQGQGSTRFESDFVDAVNVSTRRINQDADLETRISMIDSPEDELALSDEYLNVLSDLVTISLIGMGQRPAKGAELDVDKMEARMPNRIDMIRQDILNQAQAADTDDETSFVGVGALG